MMDGIYQVYETDNVATALGEVPPGAAQIRGGSTAAIIAADTIPTGHKIAVVDIAEGDDVRKYGIRIGIATTDIHAGTWVHLHNMRSAYDERSSHLDPVTGAPTDTEYA
jgi:altronate dehydratase